jgi:hypothetical protein
MTTIIIDDVLRERIKDLEHEAIFRDESGRNVGRFVPEAEYMKLLYQHAQQLFDDEELDRAAAEPGGKTTAEVLERLSKL